MFNTGRTGGGGGAKTTPPIYRIYEILHYLCKKALRSYLCIYVYLYMLPKAGQNFKFFSFEIQFFLINYDLFKITGNGCAGPLRYINISPILRVMS